MDTSDTDNLADIYDISQDLPSAEGDDVTGTGEWISVRNTSIFISIDGVDQQFLENAQAKVPLVLNNIWKKIFGSCQREMEKIKPSLLLNSWLDPMNLALMKKYINDNLASDPVSNLDITAFL